jgi:hypothetical protein
MSDEIARPVPLVQRAITETETVLATIASGKGDARAAIKSARRTVETAKAILDARQS